MKFFAFLAVVATLVAAVPVAVEERAEVAERTEVEERQMCGASCHSGPWKANGHTGRDVVEVEA